jgi:hypothetical protein
MIVKVIQVARKRHILDKNFVPTARNTGKFGKNYV